MPQPEPTFTDWAQLEAEDRRRPLLIDEDFSWSEPPSKRRRAVATVEREPQRRVRYRDESEGSRGREDAREQYGREHYARGEAHDGSYDAYEPQEYAPDEYASQGHAWDAYDRYPPEVSYDQAPLDVDREMDTAWGGRMSAAAGAETYEVDPYDFEPAFGSQSSGRRTVVITGRGTSGYAVARRRRDAELSFHERAGFNPDRTAMWAVLLGIALLIGCIAH